MSTLDKKEALLDASDTIYQHIATLRRGLPIAEAKAKSGFAKLKIRKEYNAKLKALNVQYQAVWAAIGENNQ